MRHWRCFRVRSGAPTPQRVERRIEALACATLNNGTFLPCTSCLYVIYFLCNEL